MVFQNLKLIILSTGIILKASGSTFSVMIFLIKSSNSLQLSKQNDYLPYCDQMLYVPGTPDFSLQENVSLGVSKVQQ